ncbi:hypothetical protein DERF_009625 [Dermatophagoides farinae]|uniref:Uncharacterized protein n=1 Tax=Dermatophagoides farinae TaxID=6954 RepID=A0A922HVC9_DERFA|nr:uncharacterized protein LOC124495088 [Dermatophagoides farinae]KAH7637271.1 hypothetical protein HUG17_7477 [Dermatophagoides farinae]KAH9511154.1 hypothetical protein DERF_009625 [Dermatophagoides farinae]
MSLELNTLDHLFKIQKIIDNDKLIDPRLSSYYRWLFNNQCDQYESCLAIHPESSKTEPNNNNNNKELANLPELCPNCWSSMARFRLIPKKTKHKKRMKKGNNFNHNIMNAKCKNCESKFKFKALSRSQQQNIQESKKIINRTNITPSKSSISVNSKTQKKVINQSTPTTSQNSKEMLQKFLINSKKKRNLDGHTKLSTFLQQCFDN